MSSLHAATRLLVVLGLVLSTQSLLMLQVSFELRRDYIAEHFCINRDRPELECNGKCYLRARSGGYAHDELAHGAVAHDHEAGEPHTHPAPVSERQEALLGVALSVTMCLPPRTELRPPPVREATYGTRPPDRAVPGQDPGVFHPPRRV